jgi:hypothetical protein
LGELNNERNPVQTVAILHNLGRSQQFGAFDTFQNRKMVPCISCYCGTPSRPVADGNYASFVERLLAGRNLVLCVGRWNPFHDAVCVAEINLGALHQPGSDIAKPLAKLCVVLSPAVWLCQDIDDRKHAFNVTPFRNVARV